MSSELDISAPTTVHGQPDVSDPLWQLRRRIITSDQLANAGPEWKQVAASIRRHSRAVLDLTVQPIGALAGLVGAVERMARCDGTCLLLRADTGTGKTYAAVAVISELCRYGLTVRFVTEGDLLASLRPNATGRLGDYTTPQILVIDDIGADVKSAWTTATLYKILNARYEAELPTIFTTNLELSGPTGLAAYVGERTWSRLRETCIVINLAGDDRRQTGLPIDVSEIVDLDERLDLMLRAEQLPAVAAAAEAETVAMPWDNNFTAADADRLEDLIADAQADHELHGENVRARIETVRALGGQAFRQFVKRVGINSTRLVHEWRQVTPEQMGLIDDAIDPFIAEWNGSNSQCR